MKNILVLILYFFIIIKAPSQNFDVTFGTKQMKTEKGNSLFLYKDESPVPDLFSTQLNLKGQKQAIAIAADYDTYKGKKEIVLIGRMQGYISEILGVDLGVGISYPLIFEKNKKLTFLPELMIVYGTNRLSLGSIKVQASGSVYIKVNDIQYKNYTDVEIALKNNYLSIKPGLKINYIITEKYSFNLFTGYHIANGKSTVDFTGLNSNDEKVVAEESIGISNMYFNVNGIVRTDAPFRPKGLELRLGIGIKLY